MTDRIQAAFRQVRQSARTRSMYPHGHPSRGVAAGVARHALMDLFRSVDRVDLMVSPHGFSCEDEDLVDEDGSLRQMASFLRTRRIGCVTIQRGITDEEADLLLDLVAAASGAEEHRNITQRLAETETEFLHVTEIDYESFVPASEASAQRLEGAASESSTGSEESPGSAADDPGSVLSAADVVALLELPEAPDELTQALLSCVAVVIREEGDEICAGLTREGQADEAPVPAANGLDRLQAAGAALARAVQRFAEGACKAHPGDQNGVFARLASALRRMAPKLLAFAFRADVVGPEAPFDSLREIGMRLTTEEAVEIICAPLDAIEAEPPEVYDRLVERLAPTPERLAQLSAALREALTERGIPADGLVAALETSLEKFRASAEPTGQPIPASPAPVLRRTPESVRADRRAALAGQLNGASHAASQVRRVAACAELLVLPQLPGRFPALLADLRECLSNVADDLRPELEAVALKALSEAGRPSSHLSADARAEALSLIEDIASLEATERLRRSLQDVHDEDRLRALRALSLIRRGGNASVVDFLFRGDGVQGEEEASAIADMLADAEEVGLTGQVGLPELIASSASRHAKSVIRALAARGGEIASRHLTVALARGEYAVRRTVVDAAGQADAPIIEVLVTALQDEEEDICAAAARHLAASGDLQAPRHLLGALQAGSLFRPRFGQRIAAAVALGEMKYEPAADSLAGILRRPSLMRRTGNDRLREAVARALVEVGTQPALDAVAARQHGERSPEIQELAALAAERLGENRPEPGHGEEGVPDAI